MAESTVTEHSRQQGRRLSGLREHSGLSKGRLLDALGFRTTQAYDLYERGVSVIRMDRVPDWAAAFGLSETAFVAVLLGHLAPADAYWSFRDALRGQIPDDQIEALVREHERESVTNQRAIAEILVRQAGRIDPVTKPQPEARPA